ncbi:MAG: T9SS type A sorting domain-containing protein [Ignavibacteria bacterium]|nr:T9SS type A sorting domain-containing protein [Ignavibacteria bacterium]
MKYLVIILLGFTLHGKSPEIYAHQESSIKAVIDSSIFNYYPLNVGNRWSWNLYRNYTPGSGYISALITGTQVIRNHLYYKMKIDSYIIYTNQYTSGYSFLRIDSLTGNFYSLYISGNDTSECLNDSLNTPVNDSAFTYCIGSTGGSWYTHTRGTYNFLNQTYISESFGWTNYFEAYGYHVYARGIGKVYSRSQGMMTYTEEVLKGCIINGQLYGDTTFPVGVIPVSTEIPEKFSLSQNYPNPFNPVTKIKFSIPQNETTHGAISTRLIVYDALGKELAILVNQQLQPGIYEAEWDASSYPSGVYYYKLKVEKTQRDVFTDSKKMVLIK